MKSYHTNNERFVTKVFKDVFDKYDIMNDLMSFGAHRIWKKNLITWMNPQEGESLIDVASGTGDLALSFSKKIKEKSKIVCVEPNKSMLSIGKNKLKNIKNVSFYAPAKQTMH